jgi:hypothetical protein
MAVSCDSGKFLAVFLLAFFSCGCATKMAYLNTQKSPEEIGKDRASCQMVVDFSDFKDAGLRQKKFNQCMKDNGYKVVSADKAQKLQGFLQVWIKQGIDYKAYDAVIIEKVDLSRIRVDTQLPGFRASQKDINTLGEEMLRRFSASLNYVIPVITDIEKAKGKRVIYVSPRFTKAAQANISASVALQVVGQFTPSFVPLPDPPVGTYSFRVELSDYSSGEKLIIVSDECSDDKNASLAGIENYERWKHAYNIIDYWADHLAALLAKERGLKYKSRLGIWGTGIKLIDF